MAKVTKVTKEEVWGFILYFGYAESSLVSPVIIHHLGKPFSSLKEAVCSLANEFLRDYLEGFEGYSKKKAIPSVEDFERYLYDSAGSAASEGPGFLSYIVNDEHWWAWDPLDELVDHFHMFYIGHRAEEILPIYVNLDLVSYPEFKNELLELQSVKRPTDKFEASYWNQFHNVNKAFKPLIKKTK